MGVLDINDSENQDSETLYVNEKLYSIIQEKIYSKPNLSCSQLIAEALVNSLTGCMVLHDIHLAISARHPFYKSKKNWKTEIKQNLITDHSFVRNVNSTQMKDTFWKLSETLSESVLKVVSAESNSVLLPNEEPNISPNNQKNKEIGSLIFPQTNSNIEKTSSGSRHLDTEVGKANKIFIKYASEIGASNSVKKKSRSYFDTPLISQITPVIGLEIGANKKYQGQPIFEKKKIKEDK